MMTDTLFYFYVPPVVALILILIVDGKNLRKWLKILVSLTLPFLLILTGFGLILFDYTGGGMNEVIIYHLATGFGEINKLHDFYPHILLFSGLSIAGLILFWLSYRYFLSWSPKKNYPTWSLWGLTVLIASHPLIIDIATISSRYFEKPTTEEILAFKISNQQPAPDEYLFPSHLSKKNIIYLFFEAGERAFYADQDHFPNLMPHLRKIASQHIEFTNIQQLRTTFNTISGTIASQCGVPLVGRSDVTKDGSTMDSFLPNTLCMGEILENNGYNNIFLSGYLTSFTHKKVFYHNHGFDKPNIIGLDELTKDKNHSFILESWNGGIHDYDLFQIMKEKVNSLYKDESPYFMVVNTLDTHQLDGTIDQKNCGHLTYDFYKKSNLPISLKCTDKALKDFYEFLKNHPSADDTILIIASDHLFPAGPLSEVLFKIEERVNTFIIVDFSSNSIETIDRLGLPFDLAPTILNYLGFPLESLHFGRNLFNVENKSLLADFLDTEELDEMIRRWSRLFSLFWLPNQEGL